MTPNQITTLIASNLDKQLDQPFKLIMMERVKYWRSRLLKNSLEKDEKDRKYFKQVIFVPMTEQTEVLCTTPYCQCEVAISAFKVPKPLRVNGILFDYVGAIDGNNPFKETSAGMVVHLLNSKYGKKFVYYAYENGYIKVYNHSKLPMIRIEGIFDNPEEASKLSCKDKEEVCDYWNQEYPVTGDITQLIVQSILQIDYNRKGEQKDTQIPVTQQSDRT